MSPPPAAPKATPAGHATRHAGIDRGDVVDTALAIVEQGGAEALTMRKLAAELGVTTTTIYWHVGSRDDLVTALVERLGASYADTPVSGTTPHERVMAVARQVWSNALAHPEVTRLAHQHGAASLLQIHLEVALARELTAAGLSGAAGRDALRAILVGVGGFLVLALRPPDTVPVERAGTTLWQGIDDDRVDPTMQRALTEPADLDALFERTLSAIVTAHLPT